MGRYKLVDPTGLPADEDLELLVNKLSLFNHFVAKANGWLKYFRFDANKAHLEHSLRTFVLADKLVDLIRFESTEFQSKLYWREQSSKLYMKAVEVCHLLNRPKEAYYFMERNKALLLLEDLTNEQAKEIARVPAKKAQREFDLKRAIFLSENKLQEDIGLLRGDSIAVLKEVIRDNKYKYKKFVDSLNKTYPNYAKFKRKWTYCLFNNCNQIIFQKIKQRFTIF